MHERREKGLDEIVFGNLIEMCWSCDWLRQGRCKGIEKDDIQEGLVVITSEHFSVIANALKIPNCPKIDFDPELN